MWVWQLRLREGKWLLRGHRAGQRQRWIPSEVGLLQSGFVTCWVCFLLSLYYVTIPTPTEVHKEVSRFRASLKEKPTLVSVEPLSRLFHPPGHHSFSPSSFSIPLAHHTAQQTPPGKWEPLINVFPKKEIMFSTW